MAFWKNQVESNHEPPYHQAVNFSTTNASSALPPQFNTDNLGASQLGRASDDLPGQFTAQFAGLDMDLDKDYVHIPPSYASGETATTEDDPPEPPVPARGCGCRCSFLSRPTLSEDNLALHGVIDKPREVVLPWIFVQQGPSLTAQLSYLALEAASATAKPPRSLASLTTDFGSWVPVFDARCHDADVAGTGSGFDNAVIPPFHEWSVVEQQLRESTPPLPTAH